MDHQPSQPGAQSRKARKTEPKRRKKIEKTGQIGDFAADGNLVFPTKAIPEIAVALRQQPSAKPLSGVYELEIEALEARPEFANMMMYSRHKTSSPRVWVIRELLETQNPNLQEKIRSDTLDSALHRDPMGIGTTMIWARMVWKLRDILERNIAAREQSNPPISQDQILANRLPVPMESFRQSEGAWWKLLFLVGQLIHGSFGSRRIFAADSSSPYAIRVRAAVVRYRQQHGITGDSQYGGQINEDPGESGINDDSHQGDQFDKTASEVDITVDDSQHQDQSYQETGKVGVSVDSLYGGDPNTDTGEINIIGESQYHYHSSQTAGQVDINGHSQSGQLNEAAEESPMQYGAPEVPSMTPQHGHARPQRRDVIQCSPS